VTAARRRTSTRAAGGHGRARTRWPILLTLLVTLSVPLVAHAQTTPVSPRIADLVAHLDDDADPLHADYTPAVWGLCELGLDAAAAVVPLLDASADMTRLRASRVLECVVSRHFGWRAGQGYPRGSDGEARFRALWQENGAYAYDATPEARQIAAARWAAWLAAHAHDSSSEPSPPSTRTSLGLERALRTARTCVHIVSPIAVWADVTFAPDGSVTRVDVHGAEGASERCIQRALRRGRVAPSVRTQTVGVTIVGARP
jgi:hypothetical protein